MANITLGHLLNLPQSEDIRNRLLVARLPTLPHTLIKLLAMCQSDDVGMFELARLIAVEPSLTSRVLSVANSAAYHRSSQRLNLQQACNTLGTEMIKVLVISESVFQTFGAFSTAASADLRAFWKHSLNTAVICKLLAEHLNYPQPDEAYLAGLLHDVGRLALLSAAPQHYRAFFLANDDQDLCDVEQQTLKISHAEAGAWLTRRWQLEDHLVESILYHHEDVALLGQTHPLVLIVHLAHQLSCLPEGDPTAADNLIEGGLEVSPDEIHLLVHNATVQLTQTARDMGIDISDHGPLPASPATNSDPSTSVTGMNSAQAQLAQEIRDRTLLNDMGQVLLRQANTAAILTSIRQHAGILLNLENALIMLMRENQKTLVPASMNEKCRPVTRLFTVADHPVLANCVHEQKLSWTNRATQQDHILLDMIDAEHLVCIALVHAKRCLGVIVAAVPVEQLSHTQSLQTLLQGFGIHAGAALATRTQTERAQKMSLSTLKKEQQLTVKKIAHEVNNPIGVIKNYLEVIDGKIDRQEPVANELAILGAEVDRVGKIVDNFTQGRRTPVFAPIDIHRLVREMVQLLTESRFFPASIQITCQLPEQVNMVIGSADLIKQILLNLIKNARECMPAGGQITLGGGALVRRNGKVYALLSVTDTGPGLSAEVQAQLFSPVNSSKEGDNRGLGLNIVKGLVLQMAGSISCQTAPTGTSFNLLLPCVAQAAPSAETAALSATGSSVD